jgi:hypothetical protein
MPMIDVTALAGTEARISSVERGSVLQLHSASSSTRTAQEFIDRTSDDLSRR